METRSGGSLCVELVCISGLELHQTGVPKLFTLEGQNYKLLVGERLKASTIVLLCREKVVGFPLNYEIIVFLHKSRL